MILFRGQHDKNRVSSAGKSGGAFFVDFRPGFADEEGSLTPSSILKMMMEVGLIVLQRKGKDMNFKTMKKEDLIRMGEALTAQLQVVKSLMDAVCVDRFYKAGWRASSKKCVAVPLLREERYAVDEYASHMASSLAGEGDVVSESDGWTTYQMTVEWDREQLLPRFEGLLIRYSYHAESGTDVGGVWGLLAVKA